MKMALLLLLISFSALAQPLSEKTFFEDKIIMSGSGYLQIPSGSTAERPSPDVNGTLRYNTDSNQFEMYESGVWVSPTDKNDFSDSLFSVYNNADVTKIVNLDASNITTGNTRTFSLPDSSGIFALLGINQTFSGVNSYSDDILMIGTGQLKLPVGTTAERSGSPLVGMTRFNSDLVAPEIYDGTSWVPLGSSTAIVGPATSTDNAVVRYDGVTGKLAKDSAVIIDDFGRISQPNLNLSTYLGVQAGTAATVGTLQNTGIGFQAGNVLSTGNNNTFVGSQAGRKTSQGNQNTAFGSRAFENNGLGDNNTAVGYRTLQNHTSNGGDNTAIGMYSQRIASSGFYNTTVGVEALENNISGDRNTVMGYKAGTRILSHDNVVLGSQALGHESGGAFERNVIIGTQAGLLMTGTATDNILIGDRVETSSPGAANEINIGNHIVGNMSTKLMGIGVTTPTVALDVDGAGKFTSDLDVTGDMTANTLQTIGDVTVGGIGRLQIPAGTTLERPAVPINGMMRFNTDLQYFEGYNGVAWVQMETGAAASGDVVGPLSATDNAIVRYDGITGKIIQDSSILIDDSDNITGAASIATAGLTVASTTAGAHPCPTMSEAQRDATTPALGDCVINTDSNALNVYNGTIWQALGAVDLTSDVTGVLPVANGGTNSSTALGNDKVMYSQGGAVVESGVALDSSANMSGLNSLTVTSTSAASHACPTMTEVQRDALTPNAGDCVYNSDTNLINNYNGTIWLEHGSTITMQSTYDSSTSPQLTLDGTRNGIRVRDNSTPITADLFSVTDNAGTTEYLNVDASGVTATALTSPSLTVSTTAAINGRLAVTTTGDASLPCPVMTEVQRDALTPVAGDCVYNSNASLLNFYNGSVWGSVGGSTTNQDVYENSTQPQITLDGTRDGMRIIDNSTPIAAPLFQVMSNDTLSTYFEVGASKNLSTSLDVNGRLVAISTTEPSVPCPIMTEVQRDATTPAAGDCVYNSNTNLQNTYNGSAWVAGGGSSSTLQDAYDNSTQPQITLDGTGDAFQIRDNSTPLAAPLFAVQDNAGTTDHFEVSAAKTTVTGELEVNSTTLPSRPVPSMTTAQMNATTPATGDMVYNSTANFVYYYNGTAWIEMNNTGAGIPTMAKGSLFASNGTTNGEFTACANTEYLEWDSTAATGFKCVAKLSLPITSVTSIGTNTGLTAATWTSIASSNTDFKSFTTVHIGPDTAGGYLLNNAANCSYRVTIGGVGIGTLAFGAVLTKYFSGFTVSAATTPGNQILSFEYIKNAGTTCNTVNMKMTVTSY